MARPSKLTPDQWQEVGRRIAAGEGTRDVAKEFDIDPAAISRRFPHQSQQAVRNVAHQLAEAQSALAVLPVAQQHVALNLADELRAISTNLAGAARFGSATAHRLAALAHGEVSKIDQAAPLDIEALKGASALTRMANDAAVIPTSLLNANKDGNKTPAQAEAVRELIERGVTFKVVRPSS